MTNMIQRYRRRLYVSFRRYFHELLVKLRGIVGFAVDYDIVLCTLSYTISNFFLMQKYYFALSVFVAGTLLGIFCCKARFEYTNHVVVRKVIYVCLCETVLFVRLILLRGYETSVDDVFHQYIGKKEDLELFISEIDTSDGVNKEIVGQVLSVNNDSIIKRKYTTRLKIPVSVGADAGEVCAIRGTIVKPDKIDDFDYPLYLKTKRIYYTVAFPEIYSCRIEETNLLNKILLSASNLGNSIDSIISHNLPEPQSSLLIGFITGRKKYLDPEFSDTLRKAGVSHVIAASGYNVSIVLALVYALTGFLPIKARITIGLIAIWYYCLIAGAGASIVRASIMTSFTLVSKLCGGRALIHVTIPFTAAVFSLINPYVLFDVGFQLSLSATLGLVYLSPMIRQYVERWEIIPDDLLTSFACFCTTLPISLTTFKTISVVSVLTNLLTGIIVNISLLQGILAVAIYKIWVLGSKILFSSINAQLQYFVFIVEFFGKSKYSTFATGSSSGLTMATGYFALTFILINLVSKESMENFKYYYR